VFCRSEVESADEDALEGDVPFTLPRNCVQLALDVLEVVVTSFLLRCRS
jgi:hypothetical protein